MASSSNYLATLVGKGGSVLRGKTSILAAVKSSDRLARAVLPHIPPFVATAQAAAAATANVTVVPNLVANAQASSSATAALVRAAPAPTGTTLYMSANDVALRYNWVHKIFDTLAISGGAIAVSGANDGVYFSGLATDSIDFFSGFVAKYNKLGELIFVGGAKVTGANTGNNAIDQLAVAPDGTIFWMSSRYRDGFGWEIAQISPQGQVIRSFGDISGDLPRRGISLDLAGTSLFVAASAAYVGPAGGYATTLTKYTAATGAVAWTTSYITRTSPFAYGVVVGFAHDKINGVLYVLTVTYQTSALDMDYVSAFDEAGTLLWCKSLTGSVTYERLVLTPNGVMLAFIAGAGDLHLIELARLTGDVISARQIVGGFQLMDDVCVDEDGLVYCLAKQSDGLVRLLLVIGASSVVRSVQVLGSVSTVIEVDSTHVYLGGIALNKNLVPSSSTYGTLGQMVSFNDLGHLVGLSLPVVTSSYTVAPATRTLYTATTTPVSGSYSAYMPDGFSDTELTPNEAYDSPPRRQSAFPSLLGTAATVNASPGPRALLGSPGTSQTAISFLSQPSVAGTQAVILGTFVSRAFVSNTTIGVNDVLVGLADKESNAALGFRASYVDVYVWRPSTGAVVGRLAAAGAEAVGTSGATTTEKVSKGQLVASSVNALVDDVIVAELWGYVAGTNIPSYTGTAYYGGADTTSADGASSSNYAAFITFAETFTLASAPTACTLGASALAQAGAGAVDLIATPPLRATPAAVAYCVAGLDQIVPLASDVSSAATIYSPVLLISELLAAAPYAATDAAADLEAVLPTAKTLRIYQPRAVSTAAAALALNVRMASAPMGVTATVASLRSGIFPEGTKLYFHRESADGVNADSWMLFDSNIDPANPYMKLALTQTGEVLYGGHGETSFWPQIAKVSVTGETSIIGQLLGTYSGPKPFGLDVDRSGHISLGYENRSLGLHADGTHWWHHDEYYVTYVAAGLGYYPNIYGAKAGAVIMGDVGDYIMSAPANNKTLPANASTFDAGVWMPQGFSPSGVPYADTYPVTSVIFGRTGKDPSDTFARDSIIVSSSSPDWIRYIKTGVVGTADENFVVGWVGVDAKVYVAGASYSARHAKTVTTLFVLNSDGSALRERDIYSLGSATTRPRGMTGDRYGNVYIFLEGVEEKIGELIKYDAAGDILWQRRFAYQTSDTGTAAGCIAADDHFVYCMIPVTKTIAKVASSGDFLGVWVGAGAAAGHNVTVTNGSMYTVRGVEWWEWPVFYDNSYGYGSGAYPVYAAPDVFPWPLALTALAQPVASTGPPLLTQSAMAAHVTALIDYLPGRGARTMTSVPGSAQAALAVSIPASVTAPQAVLLGIHVSSPLRTNQTFGGTYVAFAIADMVSNAALAFTAGNPEIYVWRPSTRTKVGTIRNAWAATYGTSATTEKATYGVALGSAVSALAGDVVVVEIWATATNSPSAVYTGTAYLDGAVDCDSNNTPVTDQASYIQFTEILDIVTEKHLAAEVRAVAVCIAGVVSGYFSPAFAPGRASATASAVQAVQLQNFVGDPYCDKVALLVHFEGPVGSTAIYDSSPANRTIEPWTNNPVVTDSTRYDQAKIVDTWKSSGTTSLRQLFLDAFGHPVTPQIDLPGDFTIEAYVFPDKSTWGGVILSNMNQTQGWAVSLYPQVGVYPEPSYYPWHYMLEWRAAGASGSLGGRIHGGLGLNKYLGDTPVHIAISRVGNTTYGFINGVGGFITGSTPPLTPAGATYIGGTVNNGYRQGTSDAADGPFRGHIDELRVTLGVGRYTSNFIPPGEQFLSTYTNLCTVSSSATATMLWVPETTHLMGATPAAVASGAADLDVHVVSIAFAQPAGAVASSSADLGINVRLVSAPDSSFASSEATGELALTVNLSLVAPISVASATAGLKRALTASATAAAVSTATADFTVVTLLKYVAADAAATATATAAALQTVKGVATAAATASASADLLSQRVLASTSASAASASAQLTVTRLLETAAQANAVIGATLAIAKAIASSAQAVATLNANPYLKVLYTPDFRRGYIVPPEDRHDLIESDVRVDVVDADPRMYIVGAAPRTSSPPTELRVFEAPLF